MEIKYYLGICQRMEKYVKQCTLDHEEDLPTFRKLAKRYHINLKLVEQITEDVDLLGHNVGLTGSNNGHIIFENHSDYTAEWMGDDETDCNR